MANWTLATLEQSGMVADDVKSLIFSVENWQQHQAGQHYDIRLTSKDGYQAERSYSTASPPEQRGVVEFGIQLLKDGEVSPYLFQMQLGDQLELRGPIGGHFIWNINLPGPLVLIGGGSGMVPLMCMLRHYKNSILQQIVNSKNQQTNRKIQSQKSTINHKLQTDNPELKKEVVFLISAQSFGNVLYKKELTDIAQQNPDIKIIYTLTKEQPEDWTGYNRRVDTKMVEEVFGHLIGKMPMIYVCGPTPFVEEVAKNLLSAGFNDHEIRTERFGG